MPFGTKGVSIAVLAAAVLTTAACGGSGKAATPPASTSAKGAPTTLQTASTTPTTQAASSSGASGATLTKDQLAKALLTDKDDAGYTFDASQDSAATTDIQDRVATGGTACQTFIDAQEALSTKYGTTAEVDRQLTDAAGGHTIEDSVMAFPSAAKSSALITDLTASLKGCQSLSVPQAGGGSVAMQPSAIPELTKDGQVGYIDYLTVGGKTELVAADLVHVGTTVSVVAFIGPVTNDPNALKQMGGTVLSHLSDIQIGRLKTAQGLG